LWLDIFPAGTIIPPQSLAPTFLCLAAMRHFGITEPSLAALPVVMALPFGRVFSHLERQHRQFCNEGFTRLGRWVKGNGSSSGPGAFTRRAMLTMLPVNLTAFAIALTALLGVMNVALPALEPSLRGIGLTWPHMWVVGSMGAVLSLRHRPAYALLAAGAVLACLGRLIV
jgi:PTS system mannose-specific IIC component